MKIDYKHFFVFLFIFVTIQYLMVTTEFEYYYNVTSDIQGYKFNFYKNLENNFTLKSILLYIFGYIVITFFMYYYLISPIKKGYIEGFIFTSMLCAFWDACVLFCFDKGTKHLPVLLFDIFIVGGIGMIISQYIFYNYYNILKNYIPLLFILYILSMLLFFYECYKYNPDLSNIKGIVLF
jgi:hypothetical protein